MATRSSPQVRFLDTDPTQVKISPEIRVNSPLVTPPNPMKAAIPPVISTAPRRGNSLATLSVISQSNTRRRRRLSSYPDMLDGSGFINSSRNYFDKDYPPIENFRKAVKLVQILLTVCEIGYETKEKDELKLARYFTFTEYAASQEDEHLRNDLSFDAKLFRANKEMRLTAEIKSILTKPPKERNNQQLAKVLFALRSIQSFAEYPVRMQKKLVKVGWYEGHSSKRVILRQGHPPQAFYFVLSGSAVVKIIDRQQNVARTICFMRRGDSFGELALLHDTKRQSTVISREQIELLCISKEDFIDIFMAAGGVKNINDPDHAEFISSLEFLQGWPTEVLPKYPKKFLFHFFRRGAVLVRDSNFSDWIYVVKSGSCQVLKKLKKVSSQVKQNAKLKESSSRRDSVLSVEKLHDLSVSMARKQRNHVLDQHARAIHAVASAQELGVQDGHCSVRSPAEGVLFPVSIRLEENRLSSLSNRDGNINNTESSPPDIGSARMHGSSQRPNSEKMRSEEEDRVTGDSGRGRASCASESLVRGKDSFEPRKSLHMSLKRQRNNQITSNFYIQTPSTSDTGKRLGSPQHKLAIIDEAAKKHEASARLTEADMNPCFVQVAVLQKGDVFGLHSMFCDNQPSLSLVSNGAECIMVLKKFYLERCSEPLKARLRKKISPYPDNFELQTSLQEKVNWDHFKSQTLKEAIRNSKTLKRIKDKSVI